MAKEQRETFINKKFLVIYAKIFQVLLSMFLFNISFISNLSLCTCKEAKTQSCESGSGKASAESWLDF